MPSLIIEVQEIDLAREHLNNNGGSVNDGDMEINVFKSYGPGKSKRRDKHQAAQKGITNDHEYAVEDITPEQKKQVLTSLSTVMSLAVKRHTNTDADTQDSDMNMDVTHNPGNPHNTTGHSTKYTNQDQDRTALDSRTNLMDYEISQ